jgi:membrane associated rhomboid family serine protease
MIGIRLTKGEVWIREGEWAEWVLTGRVTSETWVNVSGASTGPWQRAGDLDIYRRLRPELGDPDSEPKLYPEEILARGPGVIEPVPRAPDLEEPYEPPGLGSVIFPRQGLSATEGLVLGNLIVFGVLLFLWRQDYGTELRATMERWYGFVSQGQLLYVFPTLFMHADPKHLFFNMASLLATCAGVEYLFGRWRAVGGYLLTGLGGAALSFSQKTYPIISVGASGAIFGLAGIMVLFLIRFYRYFTERQKWKTRRIYVPLLVLFIVPSIFQADGWAHLGGFIAGLVVGAFLPPGQRIRLAFHREDPGEEIPSSPSGLK